MVALGLLLLLGDGVSRDTARVFQKSETPRVMAMMTPLFHLFHGGAENQKYA